MKFIGITGGVGAGKSAILSYLADKPDTRVMLADEIAHDLMEPGTDCYRRIVEQFQGLDIFVGQADAMEPGTDCDRQIVEQADSTERETDYLEKNVFEHEVQAASGDEENNGSKGEIMEMRSFDRMKLAQVIFSDAGKREQMNAIVHPAVKEYVRQQYALEQEKGSLELLVLEAALLIEEEYDEICDELWYIYTSEENRRKRLKISRGYSDEKIDNIFRSQLSEAEFRKSVQVTIDNNGDLVETMNQIEKALRRKVDE